MPAKTIPFQWLLISMNKSHRFNTTKYVLTDFNVINLTKDDNAMLLANRDLENFDIPCRQAYFPKSFATLLPFLTS